MTNIGKFLGRVGMMGMVLLALQTMAVGGPDNGKNPKLATQAAQDRVATPTLADSIAPLPADATAVPDDYLLKLSALVDLANARDHAADKTRWAQAIPIAQKLLQGPCDCKQRNWLNHFVEMGNDASSNAEDRYHEHAYILLTLGRNDSQAMAMSHKAQ